MSHGKLTLFTAVLALGLSACGQSSATADGGTGGGTGGGSAQGAIIDVTQAITSNTTWSASNTYVLKQIIHVDGATLTVEPGTKVLGERGSALVVTRTAKLMAEGTATSPIVFSANYPLGMRGVGNNNWGGIVLNGKAAINVAGGDNKAEGLADDPKNRYGGGATPDATHSCGSLKYVRIEFAGEPLSANDELNGLTLNACGSNTVVDFVQVHRGIDDGIEIFGGTVNLKHVIMSGSDDDGLDWDQGWTGKAQFVVIQQLPGRGNHGLEADNNRTANDAAPRSAPVIYNGTIIGRAPDASNPGEGTSRGMVFRVGTAGQLFNLIVMNFNDFAMSVDGSASKAQWEAGALAVKNSIFSKNPVAPWNNVTASTNDNGFDESLALQSGSMSNRDADPMVMGPTSATAPKFQVNVGSPALSGAAAPPNDGFFDQSATFLGAVGPSDWTDGWTAYPEN
jgi:hypothetical protein